jgi:hypothetical protein
MPTVKAQSLLLVCDLSKKCRRTIAPKPDVVAKADVVAKPGTWTAFAIAQNLNEEYFYFDRHKVKEYTGDERVYWVGIGCLVAKPSVNPKSQFLLFKTPAQLSGKESREVRSFSKKVFLMVELYDQTTAEDAKDGEIPLKCYSFRNGKTTSIRTRKDQEWKDNINPNKKRKRRLYQIKMSASLLLIF